MTDLTIGIVLADIKKQLDWRGPNGREQGVITSPRAYAEYLHEWAIRLCNAKDDMEQELGKMRELLQQARAEVEKFMAHAVSDVRPQEIISDKEPVRTMPCIVCGQLKCDCVVL